MRSGHAEFALPPSHNSWLSAVRGPRQTSSWRSVRPA